MIEKSREKTIAIQLRKQGLSYNEILRQVPVAKSTLSVWLKDIGLAKHQRQQLTLKRKMAQGKAQEACRRARIAREHKIIEGAKKDALNISEKDLWLIGTILYWAEGTKQKRHNVSQRVSFGNSDPKMIVIFDRWIKEICGQKQESLVYMIYIHRTGDKERAKRFWENLLHITVDNIYFKNHNPKTNRKNIQENYYGLFRIDVKRSTDLNRKIHGWILGITDKLHS